MTFDLESIDLIFEIEGRAAAYARPESETTDCTVVLDCGGGRTDADMHLSVRTLGRIFVRESELVESQIRRGDIFEIGSERWSVLRPVSRNGGVFVLEVQRESR